MLFSRRRFRQKIAEVIDDQTHSRHLDEKCAALKLTIQNSLPQTEVRGWKIADIDFTMECLSNFEVIADGYHTWEDPGHRILGTCADSIMAAKNNGKQAEYDKSVPPILREMHISMSANPLGRHAP